MGQTMKRQNLPVEKSWDISLDKYVLEVYTNGKRVIIT